MLRIVGGRYGGRRVTVPATADVRPTSERVREALFDMLFDVQGFSVLDLFSGSGVLALEAISRGASRAVAVDASGLCCETIRHNVERIGVGPGVVDVVRSPVDRYLAAARRAGERFDLAMADPPYRIAERMASVLTDLLPPLMTEGGMVVFESSARSSVSPGIPVVKQRRYGGTMLSIHSVVSERRQEWDSPARSGSAESA